MLPHWHTHPPHGVEQIVSCCGLSTAANLCLRLARDTSTTPTAYRRIFQGPRVPAVGRLTG